MNKNEENVDRLFDEAIDSIRQDEPTEAQVHSAAERAWAKIEARHGKATEGLAPHAVLSSEADYESLFEAYYNRTLPEARRELLEARLHENVATRLAWNEFKATKEGKLASFSASSTAQTSRRKSGISGAWMRWAAVAAMIVATAGVSWYGWNAWGPDQTGPQASIFAANGPLYRVDGNAVVALAAGEQIGPRQRMRVPEGTRATIKLRDGSLVELRPGSTFSLSSFGKDVTVHLSGGDVIVEAAKRNSGHLYVASPDMQVEVTGTVFAVGTGVKGSRVGVLEGSVRVAHNSTSQALKPGQQYATMRGASSESLEDQISWSENFRKHLALLNSLTELDNELGKMQLPSLRYQSALLRSLPANTMIYVSVPNLEGTIQQARQILSNRLQADAVLREWLNSTDGKVSVDTLLGELQGFSGFFGDEMLLVSLRKATNLPDAPALVAALGKQGFEEHIRARMAALAQGGESEKLHFYHSLAELASAPSTDGLHILMTQDRLVLSPELSAVRSIGAALASGEQGGILATDFGARVQQIYTQGAGFFLAADVTGIAKGREGGVAQGAEFTGVNDLRFLEIEQKQVNGAADLRSTFSFASERTGMASWLAAPGALRALEFVSSQAAMVSAATVKDPAAMLEDLLKAVTKDENAAERLAELESKLNLRIREDVAEPLGNEVAFAIDGPVIPVPSWKLVVQVNDPVRLNTTIQRIVEAFNREMSLRGKPTASFTSEAVDGLTFHTVALPTESKLTTVHYVFASGYLLAGPDRGLLLQAVQTQASGTSILSAAAFRDLLPADKYTGFSGVFFQQAASAVASIAGQLAASPDGGSEQAQAMQELAKELKPTLVAAYAEPQSVTIASRSGLFGVGGNSLLRMGMLMEMLDRMPSSNR